MSPGQFFGLMPLLVPAPSREWNRNSLCKWQLHGLATFSCSLRLFLLICIKALTRTPPSGPMVCAEEEEEESRTARRVGQGWREVGRDKREVTW